MAIIEVEHITKEYQLGQLESLKTMLANQVRRIVRRPQKHRESFKALDDVSFSIEAGEVVGIIGHNGAGKSTLLKLLARITSPSSGRIQVNGRIAPLIEVGAGFVPELTGRENVYLNGSILGLSRKDIDRKFDEIVDFAEMEKFIDTPVKRYSSGMKVKLAFSVATSIDSEILIVDEVLAVGDLAFQRKCFDRMEDLIKRSGRTVLLVSHNIRQVERLCSRVLLFSRGRVEMDAEASTSCTAFYDISNTSIYENQNRSHTDRAADKSGEVDVDNIRLYAADSDMPTSEVEIHQSLTIHLDLSVHTDLDGLEIVLGIHTTDFVYLASATTMVADPSISLERGNHTISCKFDDMMLTPGVYSIRLAIRKGTGAMLWYGENIKPFKVVFGSRSTTTIPQLGLVEMPYHWDLPSASPNQVELARYTT